MFPLFSTLGQSRFDSSSSRFGDGLVLWFMVRRWKGLAWRVPGGGDRRRCLSLSLCYQWRRCSPLEPLLQIMAHIWKSHLCCREYSVLAGSKQLLSLVWWGGGQAVVVTRVSQQQMGSSSCTSLPNCTVTLKSSSPGRDGDGPSPCCTVNVLAKQ